MRLVVQRVKDASVNVAGAIVGSIKSGLLVFLGIKKDDTVDDIDYLVKKLLALRIFPDEHKPMNKSVTDVDGKILVVSQFTLYADCTKGNRPSFDGAMAPADAQEMYDRFVEKLKHAYSDHVATGIFGADMKVSLINDGPVTIILNSK